MIKDCIWNTIRKSYRLLVELVHSDYLDRWKGQITVIEFSMAQVSEIVHVMTNVYIKHI
jgi:hypothetical protein